VTNLTTVAAVTKTLGHTGRLRILALLRGGPLSVCQIATVLDAPVSTMSGQLLELRRAGLVREHRRGKWVYYRLTDVEAIASVLGPVLAAIADDPDVHRDAARAATRSGTWSSAQCERREIHVEEETPERSRTVRAGWTAPEKALCRASRG
jgi:ArsR family transcriptional regulator